MTVVVTHSTPSDATFSATGATAWDATHTLAGVGTMAEQNANAVAITGGTVNNATVGATTATTGAFTTLTSTGGAVNGTIGATAPAAGTFTTITGNSTSQFGAGSANYFQLTGNTTGGGPTLRFTGSDTNIDGIYAVKGTGSHRFFTNDNNQQQFQVSHTGSAVNYVNITGAATTAAPVISALGSDTNIPLVIQPKGTGALQAQKTDSTSTGGNARGANAVDWQTSRTGATQIASGINSVIGGGGSNSATTTYSAVFSGLANTASNLVSVVAGGQSNVSSGYLSFIGGGISNTAGARDNSSVVGGQSNTAGGFYNFIGGGFTNSGTSASAVTTQSGTMNATTAVTLSGSNANIKVGQLITGTSIASYTYVAAISGTALTLSVAASGSSTSTLTFYTPHGVVVGGGNNQATGSYSFIGGGGDAGTAANRNVASGDWSTVGGGTKNVASGAGSVIAGGGFEFNANFGNIASGTSSFIGSGILNNATNTGSTIGGGWQHTTNGILSTVVGGRHGSTRSISGNIVFPACSVPVSDAQGVSQAALLILGTQTTNATATALRSDTSAASGTNQVILPNNSAYFFTGEVVSGVTGGGDTKGWTIEGVIKRGANAGSTALVGTPTVVSTYADVGAATWAIAVTADTTNGGIRVTFTGQLATTIRTVAKISTVEMTF
jgi:hypothetical protein